MNGGLGWAAATGLLIATAVPARADDFRGPGRFCGYSPVIDLFPDEAVTPLQGGMHGGSFRWRGAFGTLEVRGVGWASRPHGRIVRPPSINSPARFAQQRRRGTYQIAIWNGANGAAYFLAPVRFDDAQLAAIDRVSLFEEGQSPQGCKFRTVFVLE